MKAVRKLADRWLEEARLLREYGATEAAAAAQRHARELVEAVEHAESETLTLAQAAAESGYATRTLREKLTRGDIPNAGRKNAPRIRRADLPRRRVSQGRDDAFDATAEARAVLAGPLPPAAHEDTLTGAEERRT